MSSAPCTAALLALLGLTSSQAHTPPPASGPQAPRFEGAAPRGGEAQVEDAAQRDRRMAWWRDARFGLFVHWGLYAIPAGKWGERETHGEWIRTTARIPLEKYDEFRARFNPERFDADQWMALARRAGMRYVVITSKHHDGFALFDTAQGDFDIMSTPFRRDILREVADAARQHGLMPCWYHSIMDWHHPDYLPRRDWETDRSAAGADFDRFERFLHGQVTELLTNYGDIGVMWFDGEWENTWTPERGKRLDRLCRSIQPNIIVNNRVDKGRNDMAGLNRPGDWAGDFGTPEQEVPPHGLPGVDWESCMTMNRHWGWNAADTGWKSSTQLVRTLVDVVSKGGNFLLNVGPKADGSFPPEAVERLEAIGAWMDVNGESIHGTTASLFGALPWGRSTTRRALGGGTTIYLHLFDWPSDGALLLPGLWELPRQAAVLGSAAEVSAQRPAEGGGVRLTLPPVRPDEHCTVLRLEFPSAPAIYEAPRFEPGSRQFVDSIRVEILAPTMDRNGPSTSSDATPGTALHFTMDGTAPTGASPRVTGAVELDRTVTLAAQTFREGVPAGPASVATFTKAQPRPPVGTGAGTGGVALRRFAGRFERLPDWSALRPVAEEVASTLRVPADGGPDTLLVYEGLLRIDSTGVREFALVSDDGAKLWIGEELVVDNDGLHGPLERRGQVALARGWHPIRVAIFNRAGGFHLEVHDGPVGEALQEVEAGRLGR
jgi:alpha-L-fucosidase